MMKDDKSVNLAWQDPNTRSWHVVGLLSENKQGYSFSYTKGATDSKQFIPFSGMESLTETYVSDALFPLFYNRLLSKRRPEYPQFIKWLGLDEGHTSPIDVLSRSGGIRSTDKLQMFNRIKLNENNSFETLFFAHGLSYLNESAKKRVSTLKKGEKLYICMDCQNEKDENALLIRGDKTAEIIGYFPRYLVESISSLLKDDPKNVEISVESLSDDAPSNYKLMCKLSGNVPEKLVSSFFNGKEFQLNS